MSSEVRVVRPYVGGDEFQRMLDGVRLRCADLYVESGGQVSVSLDEYVNYPFTLQLDSFEGDLARNGAEALGLDLGDIDLLVLAVAPRLRFVDVVFKRDLSSFEELPDKIDLSGSDRPRALRAPHGGADLRVYFCLNRELKPEPVRPWRRGTWLGQQEFRVRSDLSGAGFVPIRFTDEDRAHYGLSQETARFVTLDDGDPFDPEPGPDMVRLYVDGDLLDRLATATATAIGKQLQRQLFLDAVSAIVFAAQRRLREDPTLVNQDVHDFQGSLVTKLTEMIVGRGRDTASREARQAEFRRMLLDPMAFISRLEARTGIRKDMLAAFEETR